MPTQKLTLSINPEILKCFKTVYNESISGFVAAAMKNHIQNGFHSGEYDKIKDAFKAGQDHAMKQILRKIHKN